MSASRPNKYNRTNKYYIIVGVVPNNMLALSVNGRNKGRVETNNDGSKSILKTAFNSVNVPGPFKGLTSYTQEQIIQERKKPEWIKNVIS